MKESNRTPNISPLRREEVTDPGLADVLEHAEKSKSPPVAWYLTMGNNPEVAVAFQQYWEVLHRGGTVPYEVKELCRIQIAQMIGCEFCARQLAAGTEELISTEEIQSCALPHWEHPDAKTRAALHYARTLTLDDGRDDEVYEELRQHFADAEVIELAAFFCLTMGGNRMAKSWRIEPHSDQSPIPEGAMSIHSS